MPGETIHFARRPQPPIPFRFKQKWFTLQFKNFDSALKFDMAYMLVKLCLTKLFEVNLLKKPLNNSLKTAPGWSGNALLCQTEVQVTAIAWILPNASRATHICLMIWLLDLEECTFY